jgi:hypothetical protein
MLCLLESHHSLSHIHAAKMRECARLLNLKSHFVIERTHQRQQEEQEQQRQQQQQQQQ